VVPAKKTLLEILKEDKEIKQAIGRIKDDPNEDLDAVADLICEKIPQGRNDSAIEKALDDLLKPLAESKAANHKQILKKLVLKKYKTERPQKLKLAPVPGPVSFLDLIKEGGFQLGKTKRIPKEALRSAMENLSLKEGDYKNPPKVQKALENAKEILELENVDWKDFPKNVEEFQKAFEDAKEYINYVLKNKNEWKAEKVNDIKKGLKKKEILSSKVEVQKPGVFSIFNVPSNSSGDSESSNIKDEDW
jgi:lipopolysaccharide biosynthesis regulator YciM